MRALFQYGYDRARGNRLWSASPPPDELNVAPMAETSNTQQLAGAN